MKTTDDKLRKEAESRVAFKRHVKVYVFVNLLVWAIWFFARAQNGHYDGLWPIYSTIGWGFGLLSHYFGVYHRKNDFAVEQELEKLKKERGL